MKKVLAVSSLILVMFLMICAWWYIAIPINACIYGGVARMYSAPISDMEQLAKTQENVVSWCRTGKILHD